MAFPAPNIPYRLRSADFETCLELWEEQEDPVVLRQQKETKLQQWLFVKEKSGSEDRYKIMAAETQSAQNPVYLRVTRGDYTQTFPQNPPTAVPAEFNPSLWRILKETDGTYSLAANSEDVQYELFLCVTEAGVLNTIEKRVSAHPVTNRSMHWEIVEDQPSYPVTECTPELLSAGKYRVHNLGNKQNLLFYCNNNNWTVKTLNISGVTTTEDVHPSGAAGTAAHPWLAFQGGGNKVMLWRYAVGVVRSSDNAVEVAETPNNAAAYWILERADNPSGGYHYYICPSLDRSKALSGPGPGGSTTLKVTTKKYSDVWQQWIFEKYK